MVKYLLPTSEDELETWPRLVFERVDMQLIVNSKGLIYNVDILTKVLNLYIMA